MADSYCCSVLLGWVELNRDYWWNVIGFFGWNMMLIFASSVQNNSVMPDEGVAPNMNMPITTKLRSRGWDARSQT